MTATPWVIGLPKGLFDDIFDLSSRAEAKTDSVTIESLDELVDLDRASQNNVHFIPSPQYCDVCRKELANEKYMIDGATKPSGVWACMCAACFAEHGQKIGCGYGQLYLRDDDGWLGVARFCPEPDGEA